MATDVGINGVCCGVALLLCQDGLLFQKRREEFVRVLDRAESQNTRRIDLVEDGDFTVEIGIARERVLFEVSDLCLDALGVATDRPDGGHRIHICAVGQFHRGVLGLDAPEFGRIHS